MKKILIILLAILCIPISSYAMSLSTLQNNSSRYLRIDDSNFAHGKHPVCLDKSA